MDIAGKVFIVTGGASGLGEGTARMLVANGGHVVIADMQVEKGAARVATVAAAMSDRRKKVIKSLRWLW